METSASVDGILVNDTTRFHVSWPTAMALSSLQCTRLSDTVCMRQYGGREGRHSVLIHRVTDSHGNTDTCTITVTVTR